MGAMHIIALIILHLPCIFSISFEECALNHLPGKWLIIYFADPGSRLFDSLKDCFHSCDCF